GQNSNTTFTSITDTTENLSALLGDYPGVGVSDLSVSGTLSIAELAAFDAATSGSFDYSGATIADTAENLVDNTGGYVTGDVDVEVTDAASIAQLTAIDGYTTGSIDYHTVIDTA